MKKMPAQRPGQSVQAVRTPRVFLDAVRKRLGIRDFWIDLAATKKNRVCPRYYSRTDDALIQHWRPMAKFEPEVPQRTAWGWLNPEYGDIGPWVEKACTEAAAGARVAMLVPASTGSNWWKEHVDRKAKVLLLNGRLTFVGHTSPYPKDLVLLLYSPDVEPGYEVWNWRA